MMIVEGSILLCIVGGFLVVGFLFLASAIRVVREGTRLSVYRLGRYLGDKGPGLVILIPLIDRGVMKQLEGVQKNSSQSLSGAAGETRTKE